MPLLLRPAADDPDPDQLGANYLDPQGHELHHSKSAASASIHPGISTSLHALALFSEVETFLFLSLFFVVVVVFAPNPFGYCFLEEKLMH